MLNRSGKEKNYNILYMCSKCDFCSSQRGMIKEHCTNCYTVKESCSRNPIELMQTQIKNLYNENRSYKAKISNMKDSMTTVEELKTLLQVERVKNQIYRHIIEKNTSIRVDDVVVETDSGIHIFNTFNGDIPVFVHENMRSESGIRISQPPDKEFSENQTEIDNATESERLNLEHKEEVCDSSSIKTSEETKQDVEIESVKKLNLSETKETKTSNRFKSKNKSKTNKGKYRSIKPALEPVPEMSEEERETHIEMIDEAIKEQMDSYGCISKARKEFAMIFSNLRRSRVYTKLLVQLRDARWNIFGRLSINDYYDLVKDHVAKMESIFAEKKYDVRKSTGIICKGLSPIESRMLGYGFYYNKHLHIDEIQRMGDVLDMSRIQDREYVPFDVDKLCNYFYNYGTVIFNLRVSLERFLFNQYDFNNIIYLPLPKNTEDDPYSFYTLENVNKNKRYWKMDCRLEFLSFSLASNILPYLISMFRKIYRDVFGDNEFRPDYNTINQITECDCEQLAQNILLMGQPKKFCNLVREVVRNNAEHYPTENDKFNLYGDDSLQRKRMQEKDETDPADIVKQLFDGISSENAVDFFRSRSL
mgnify:CR=1 FL=1